MNVFHKAQSRSSIIHQSPPTTPPPCSLPLRFFLYCVFSIRLPCDVESRSQGTTSSIPRHHTFGYECTRVRRTHWHLAIHSDNHNNSGTCTTSRGPTRPALVFSLATPQPSSPDLPYITASPQYTLESASHAQAIPLHVDSSGAIVTEETKRPTDKGKAKEDDKFPSVARSGSLYALPVLYATFRDEDLHTTTRIPAPHAIEGYVLGIPTAGSSSGVNQYGGYSTLRSRPCSWVGMLLPPLQLQLQP